MKTRISYYVFCFERYLDIIVNAADKSRAEEIMEQAYDTWQNNHEKVGDACLEEYICNCLKANGIEFEVVEETEEEDE